MTYVNYGLALAAAFLRLLKTINRIVAIYMPFRYADLFSNSNTRICCLALISASFIFFLPLIITPSKFFLLNFNLKFWLCDTCGRTFVDGTSDRLPSTKVLPQMSHPQKSVRKYHTAKSLALCDTIIIKQGRYDRTTCSQTLSFLYSILRTCVALLGFFLGIALVIKFQILIKNNIWTSLKKRQEKILILQVILIKIDISQFSFNIF
jgi:hypothetical protein